MRRSLEPTSSNKGSNSSGLITRYYVEQFAYLAGRLSAMKEGEGTVLDNSCLLFLSNMWSGKKHDASRLPLLQAGGLGGTIATGRVVSILDACAVDRQPGGLLPSVIGPPRVRVRSVF